MISGIALDMDGLLFDTERLYWQVGDRVLIPRGHRFSRQLQAKMMGRVGLSAVQQMIDHHNLEVTATQLQAECDEIYAELLTHGLQPMPGLNTWIDRLRHSGLPFGLATSSRRKFVDRILATTSWKDDLRFVLTGDDVVNGKPHPEMYQRAAAAMDIRPETMLVLEDSGNGCAAAVAAGAITVAIPSEHTRDQNFEGVYMIAQSLDDSRLHALLPPAAATDSTRAAKPHAARGGLA